MLLTPDDSFLLVIDVQEKLAAQINGMETVSANIIRLVKSAQTLDIPLFCTEHCPDKIGSTIAELRAYFSADSILAKSHFSACRESDIASRFNDLKRKQVVICGAETHVCVLQTTLALKQSGFQPYLVADATSSRHLHNKKLATTRMRQHQVDIVSTEMVIFEWLQRADTSSFRELLPLIKESG